jgi:hypothetical protein
MDAPVLSVPTSTSTSRLRAFTWPLALGATALTWLAVTYGRLFERQVIASYAEDFWPRAWLLHGLIHWDALWYVRIAEEGYSYTPGVMSPVAFFPGYPLVVRFVSWALNVHPYLSGVVVSSVCGVVAVRLFHAWARAVAGPERAVPATWALVVYPYAFYLFGVMYPEAFFLTLVLATFLCLEKGHTGWAALFGALTTFTRPVAPAVLLGLLVRHWELKRQRGEKLGPRDAVLLFAGAGMAAYVGYQWWAFGEPLAFAKVQSAPGWDHVPGWSTWLKEWWFIAMTGNGKASIKLQFLMHGLAAMVPLALAWPMRRKLGLGYAVYVAGVIGIPAFAMKDFWGMGRYALAAFPCFLYVTLMLETRPVVRRWLAVASGVGFCLLAVNFGRGAWVA